MPLYALADRRPHCDPTAWLAPDATVIGAVTLATEASVWFGAVIRGDTTPIAVGARSNIQDGAMLHADPGFPLTVGTGCTIGHHAILHGCTIGDDVLIGMGATILNGATIGDGCIVGANALVTEGKAFAPGTLIVGSPARAVRALPEEALAQLAQSAATYVDRARRYAADLVRLD